MTRARSGMLTAQVRVAASRGWLAAAAVLCGALAACDGGLPELDLGGDGDRPAVSTSGKGLDEIEPAVIPGVAGEPEMRVRLRDAATTTKVGTSMGDSVWAIPADASRPAAALRAPVTVALDAEGWVLADAAGLIARYPRAMDVEIAPEREMLVGGSRAELTSGTLAREATASNLAPRITVDGGRFAGKVRLTARPDATARSFDVIEQVGVEAYLRGVVVAEMWPDWPVEAFASQAVCARSYALHQRANARSAGLKFDVESSVKDQAYKGAVDSGPAADAVSMTHGVILTWNGQVLRAYYSSTSGGRPGSARDTWPTSRGYEYNLAGPIQAVGAGASGFRDVTLGSSSPYFRWQAARSRQEATARLKEWGRINGHPISALSSLSGVTQAGSNPAGRATRFAVTGGGGQRFELSAEQLRFALNQEVKGQPPIARATRVNSGDMEVSIVGDVVNIKGRGFGHGVGMCQYSVKELASKGQTWRQIVPIFYPGARLSRAY